MSPPSPLSRWQKLTLAAIVAVGVGLRLQGFGTWPITHFDEGVLVSSAFGVRLQGAFHFSNWQPLQAPPLVPWMMAGVLWLTDSGWPTMPLVVSVVFGTLSVPLLFLLARRWLGVNMGLAAAALLALSDLHIAYSRMALTDAPLTFWFVLAMFCLSRLWETSRDKGSGRPPLLGWIIGSGLAVGAAWNTKYNGWLPLAIAATAGGGALVAGRLRRAAVWQPAAGRWGAWLVWLSAASLLAVLCFLPWYRYVENSFPGGYRAVTENHLSYVVGPADWPPRAWRLLISLTAFRHLGWLLTLLAGFIALAAWHVQTWKQTRGAAGRPWESTTAGIGLGLAGLAAVLVWGADAVLLLVATAAILPALVVGRWPELLLAVWLGVFVVLAPLYFPYTRLILPALPAAICLSLLAWRAAATPRGTAVASGDGWSPRWSRGSVGAAVVFSLLAACYERPFGLVPSLHVWQRWSSRQSYEALGNLVASQTPADAVVLCQGPLQMPLYCPRRWVPLEGKPFTAGLAEDRPSYLAVDYWGLYGAGHDAARADFEAHLDCLTVVATVPNDVSFVTLLDNLSPDQVARKLARCWPVKQLADRNSRKLAVPPALDEPFDDVIVLYRIDRACLGQ